MSLKGGYVTWTAVPLIKLKNMYSSESGPKTDILALLPLLDCVGNEMSVLTSPWSMSLYKEVMSPFWGRRDTPRKWEGSREAAAAGSC